ncbi:MAG: transaldolase [Thermoproteota archaeon]|nr:transaldolase [Thermoproteota archaeon]
MLYLDTVNLDEIKQINSITEIKGITTNPKIILQTPNEKNITEVIKLINKIVVVPLSIELTKTDKSDEILVEEALSYTHVYPNVVIKVPMWGNGKGLQLAKMLIGHNVKVNLTCLMNVEQAILGCELGVEYVSLFYNRMIDYNDSHGSNGREEARHVISNVRKLIDDNQYTSRIIAGSIRKPSDISECLISGAHIVTVPYKQFVEMIPHPKTDEAIREFDEASAKFLQK